MKVPWGRSISLPRKARRRWSYGPLPPPPSASSSSSFSEDEMSREAAGPTAGVRQQSGGSISYQAGQRRPRSVSQGSTEEEGGEDEAGEVKYDFLSAHIVASNLESMPVNEDTCKGLLEDIKLLIADERLLVAERLWIRLEQWLDTATGSRSRRVKRELAKPEMVKMMRSLRERVEICHQAFRDLGSDEDWKFAQRLWGVTTHYRLKDDGRITVRLQGELSGCSVFDQLSILREADYFQFWGPFMNKSSVVKEVGKCSIVVWFNIFVPLFASRDAVVQIFACDHTEEGVILVCGESVDENSRLPPGTVIPPKPTGFNADRMEVSDFRVQVRITSPTVCEVHIIATMQPHIPLPQPIINFGTKKLAGMFLYLLQREAMKVHQDPVNNRHAIRMREHPFYSMYFIPRVVSLCRLKGWPLVSTPAFEVPGDRSKASILWRQAKQGADMASDQATSPLSHATPRTMPHALTSSSSSSKSGIAGVSLLSIDLACSWLCWSVLAGLFYLLRQRLLPAHHSLDLIVALTLRALHSITGDRQTTIIRTEALLCLIVAIMTATARCYRLPPTFYSDEASVGLILVRKVTSIPPSSSSSPSWLANVAEAVRWWDMVASPGLGLLLGQLLPQDCM